MISQLKPIYRLEEHRPRKAWNGEIGSTLSDAEWVAQSALSHWNAYVRLGDEHRRGQFAEGIACLMSSEIRAADNMSVWRNEFGGSSSPKDLARPSAGTQGSVGSAILRAYLLFGDGAYLEAAGRAVSVLQAEILDGGVGSIVGRNGFFFEDVAVYPAAHNLSGFILGLLALHDFDDIVGDPGLKPVIDQAWATWHSLCDLYDTGSWTRVDLASRQLSTRAEHAFHVAGLRALISYRECGHCANLTQAWAGYQKSRASRIHRLLDAALISSRRGLSQKSGRILFPVVHQELKPRRQVCIAAPAFPVAGGTRAIVSGIARVMESDWDVTYLTNQAGSDNRYFPVHQFGGVLSSYWQFPNVWIHCLVGLRRLLGLVRSGRRFRLILPQDASYTALFSGIVGKASGAWTVSVEHGTVLFPYSSTYRSERLAGLRSDGRTGQALSRIRLSLYWRSLRVMARLAAHVTDRFMVADDEIEETLCQRVGVHPSRVVRFNPAIDTALFAPLDPVARERERAVLRVGPGDLVIAMNGRLAPEKGLGVALAAVAEAAMELPTDLRARIRLVISGDGPYRGTVEAILRSRQLDSFSRLLGEARPDQVASLLGAADIFLYTSLRGTNTSLAVLEAMAAGCAVVASEQPRSHAKLLSDNRGICTLPGDVAAVRQALIRVLLNPDLRASMGAAARHHVVENYGWKSLKRAVLRATYYEPTAPSPS